MKFAQKGITFVAGHCWGVLVCVIALLLVCMGVCLSRFGSGLLKPCKRVVAVSSSGRREAAAGEMHARFAKRPHVPPFVSGIAPTNMGWPREDYIDIAAYDVPIARNIIGRWVRADLCKGVNIDYPNYTSGPAEVLEFRADGTLVSTLDSNPVLVTYYKIFYSLDFGVFSVFDVPDSGKIQVWDPMLFWSVEITNDFTNPDGYQEILTGLYDGTYSKFSYVRAPIKSNRPLQGRAESADKNRR